uniref:DUF7936 domain-containing protein n=1 Tax=Caulobacter sp. (strain K31) TaxID=366602 RepID=B0T648_CAUSK
MAITYTWNITSVWRSDEGAVTKLSGDLYGGSEGVISGLPFTVELGPVDPENFVAFEDLTPEILSGWAEQEMGGQRFRDMKAQIAATLDAMIAPVAVPMSPPWVAPPEEPEAPEETPEGDGEPA